MSGGQTPTLNNRQVIEAVEGRFSAQRSAGVEVSLAGQALGGASAEEREALEEREAGTRMEALTRWLRGETDEADGMPGESRALTGRDVLTGSSFALTGGTPEGGYGAVWGRGAVSSFDGREGELTLSGEVTGVMLGADWTRARGTAGLLLSHSRGEGSYQGEGSGEVSSTLTGLYPYGRWEASERVTVWGVAGYGEGELVLTPEGQRPLETDMDLMMGAVGVRGVAVEAGPQGGVELAVKSDAMAVRATSGAVSGSEGRLAAAQAGVTRVRAGLEGAWRGLEAGGGTLSPRLEVGVRHDGGDAETGFGLDLGGGLAWSHPAAGLTAELSGRGLLSHESEGFRDRGLSGSFAWDPGQGSGLGPKLTLTQTMGGPASGGADALLGQRHLGGLAANDNGGDELANRRLELRFGYGFSAFGDRFASTPEIGLGLSSGHREYTLSWRLDLARGGSTALELRLRGRGARPRGPTTTPSPSTASGSASRRAGDGIRGAERHEPNGAGPASGRRDGYCSARILNAERRGNILILLDSEGSNDDA